MRELKWGQDVFEPTETSFSAFARNKWQLFKTKKKKNVFIAGQSNMSQLSSWFLSIFSFSWTEQISRIYKKLRSFYDFYFYSIIIFFFLKWASALSPPPDDVAESFSWSDVGQQIKIWHFATCHDPRSSSTNNSVCRVVP